MLEEDGTVVGSPGDVIDETVIGEAESALSEGVPRRFRQGDTDAFIDVILPAPTMVAVGGVHIAIALTSLAKTLGYRTVVVDPRDVFGSEERFPHADRLISEWPSEALQEIGLNRSTAVATLTHDPKLDDPALQTALRSKAFLCRSARQSKDAGETGQATGRGRTVRRANRPAVGPHRSRHRLQNPGGDRPGGDGTGRGGAKRQASPVRALSFHE